MMDLQIAKVMKMYYNFPAGHSTDEFYSDYVDICEKDGVEPKAKSTVVRMVCERTGLKSRAINYFCKVENIGGEYRW